MKATLLRRGAPAGRRRALAACAGVATWVAVPGLRAQAAAPLRIGLPPYFSPGALLAAFRTVREHLERHLGRPVEMLTAKDFRSFVEAAARQDFDLVLLPAHVARLAVADWGYAPVAATVDSFSVLVLVRKGGPVRTAVDLKGRRAAMLDGLSLTATVGRAWLAQQGLADAVEVVVTPSVNSAMFALDRDEVAMVVMGDSQLRALPPTTPRSESVLATLAAIPGPIYVARPGLAAEELARLRSALLAFAPDLERPPTASNTQLHVPTPAQLAALDPYAALARKTLAAPR